jgi:hypothetical protein
MTDLLVESGDSNDSPRTAVKTSNDVKREKNCVDINATTAMAFWKIRDITVNESSFGISLRIIARHFVWTFRFGQKPQ